MAVNVGTATGYLDLNTSKFKTALSEATTVANSEMKKIESGIGQGMVNVGNSISGLGNTLTLGVTTPLVAAGAAAFKFATDFESGMTKVSTIADTSVVSIEELSEGVLEISGNTAKSANELSESLYQIVSATNDTGNALSYLEEASKLATGGFTTVDKAVDGATSVMNAYGETGTEAFTKVADILISTQNLGKTTVDELAGSLFNAIPTAASVGISFEQVGAAMATITAQGTPTSVATTQLRSAMTAFLSPSKDMTEALKEQADVLLENGRLSGHLAEEYEKQRDFLAGLVAERELLDPNDDAYSDLTAVIKDQVKVVDEATAGLGSLILEELGLADALQIVTEYADGNTDTLTGMLGSVEGMNAALQLTSETGMKKYSDSLESMSDSAGAADEAFEKMSDTTEFKLNQALEKGKNNLITFGNTLLDMALPYLEKGADLLEDFTKWLDNLSEEEKEQIIQNALWVASIGPMLSVGGKLISSIGGIIKGFQTAVAVGKTFVAFVSAPVAIGAGVLAVVGIALVSLQKEWENNIESLKTYQDKVNELADASIEASDKVKASNDAYVEKVDAMNELAQAELVQTEYTRNLVAELTDLADYTGTVEEADRHRAEFILGELNDALGTNYTMTGNQIEQYRDLRQSIYDIIDAEQARIISETYGSQQTEAILAESTQREGANVAAESLSQQYDVMEQLVNDYLEFENERLQLVSGMSAEKLSYEDALNKLMDSNIQGYAEDTAILEQFQQLMFGEGGIEQNKSTVEQYGQAVEELERVNKEFAETTQLIAEGNNKEVVENSKLTADEKLVIEKGSQEELLNAIISNNNNILEFENQKNQAVTESSKTAWDNMIEDAKIKGEKFVEEFEKSGLDAVEGLALELSKTMAIDEAEKMAAEMVAAVKNQFEQSEINQAFVEFQNRQTDAFNEQNLIDPEQIYQDQLQRNTVNESIPESSTIVTNNYNFESPKPIDEIEAAKQIEKINQNLMF